MSVFSEDFKMNVVMHSKTMATSCRGHARDSDRGQPIQSEHRHGPIVNTKNPMADSITAYVRGTRLFSKNI